MNKKIPFKYYNSSPEIIRFAVKLYLHYGLSLRKCEDMLAERGIDVSYETIRMWVIKFGPLLAAEIRKRRIGNGFCSNWRWHIDEVFVKINGELHYLWRVIDHEGEVLEVYVSRHKDTSAAVKMLKKAMRRYGRPVEIVTDKCPTYGAALRVLNLNIRHITDQYENNLCELSHQPFRRRERGMQKFRSHRNLQRIVSSHASVYNHFNLDRNKINRTKLKLKRSAANAEWNDLLVA